MPPDLLHTLFSPAFPPIGASLLRGRPRVFPSDAGALAGTLDPPPRLLGEPPQRPPGGVVVTVNHYARPGFGAWWIALAVPAGPDRPITWVITSAWTATLVMRAIADLLPADLRGPYAQEA